MRSIRSIRPSVGVGLLLSLFFVLAIVVPGHAQESTSVGATCSPIAVSVSNSTVCTVEVINMADPAANGTPQGSVTVAVSTGPGAISSNTCGTLNGSGQCTYSYTPSGFGSGTHSFSLTYDSSDTTANGWSDSSGSASVIVQRRTTSTAVSCDPSSIVVNQSTTCTATVSDTTSGTKSEPAGTISWTVTTGQPGSFTSTTCSLSGNGDGSSSSCSVDYTPAGNNSADTETHTVEASFPSNDTHAASSGTDGVEVSKRASQINLQCSDTPLTVNTPTVCAVEVVDVSPGEKTTFAGDTVDFSVTTGDGNFSATSCTLDAGGFCTSEVAYTPDSADLTTHTLTADYNGSGTHQASSDTFDQPIEKREMELLLSCPSVELFILEPMTCTVTISDDSTAGSAPSAFPGTLNIDNTVDGDDDEISSNNCSTIPSPPSGSCTFVYTPQDGDAGLINIRASYTPPGSGVIYRTPTPADAPATVKLRPTETEIYCESSQSIQESIFVNETATCYVTVKDVEAGTFEPTGTVNLATTAPSDFSIPATCALIPGSDQSTCQFNYSRSALPEAETAMNVISADYLGSTLHSGSSRGWGQGVMRRQTSTSIDCTDAAVSTCTVTVTEASGNRGPAVAIVGNVQAVADIPSDEGYTQDQFLCSLPACSFTVTPDLLLTNVSVRYEGNDVHLKSIGSDNITAPTSSLPSGGSSGATDVAAVITGLNTGCLAADAAALVLDTIQIGTDLIPDGVVVALFGGTTIPVSDLIASIFGIASTVLQTYTLAACTDLDGDGLPGVVELNITGTSDTDPDSDDDAMGDGEEVGYAGGFYGGDPKACTDPTNPDSDGDGIKDGYELSPYQTEPCNSDTDGDGVSDGQEVATRVDPIDANGFHEPNTGSFVGPFLNSRDHSNPLMQDTDGDGLNDDLEFTEGCGSSNTDGYVNDDDSDDDGYQDGPDSAADLAAAGGNDGELNDDATPSICDPDSDGDGLLDGEEHQIGTDMFDWDTDDDGLSDAEELQTYFTDPNNVDTDGDGADGQILYRAAGTAPTLSGYAGANTIACLSDCEEALSFSTQGNFVGNPLDETDPLQKDTDGDGIQDNVEFIPGCNATNTNSGLALVDGYANSFDSDGDGASDGIEGGASAPGATLADFDLSSAGDVPAAAGNDGELNDDVITNICDPDADGDGLLDGEEIGKGVDHLDWDDDDDGLSDFEELITYFTDPNNSDTDGDEADGLIAFRNPTLAPTLDGHPDVASTSIVCLSDCEESLSGTSYPPFGDPLDETDPLQTDTDGDAITDKYEFAIGCPFANDADSDGDGVPDGWSGPGFIGEDLDNDGIFDAPGAIGNSDNQVTAGETDFCNPDTDGDGLSDGDEFSLFGPQGITSATGTTVSVVVGTGAGSASATIPALDDDSDNDGLSDWEEVNAAQTDALDGDTDDDQLSDANELVASGTWPKRSFVQASDPLDANTDDDNFIENFATGTFTGENMDDFVEFGPSGSGLGKTRAAGGVFDIVCPFVDNDDSDNDGIQDGVQTTNGGFIHIEGTTDVGAGVGSIGVPGANTGEGNFRGSSPDDTVVNVCDPDSDQDGLLDGEEVDIGTNPDDWDTDNDGLSDREVIGEGPSPTDPLDPDTDDDGLPDGIEVSALVGGPDLTTTNPNVADTDGDGLCDGGETARAIWDAFSFINNNAPARDMSILNPVCVTGVGDHPNPNGYGEDLNGDGISSQIPTTFGDSFTAGFSPAAGAYETDPNNPDTDSDGLLDGVEALAYSTTRSTAFIDGRGRPSRGVYPNPANPPFTLSCLNPLGVDSDLDGLTDGYEDFNHDGNWDFLITDFDHFIDPLGGQEGTDPEETNPCDADSDDDSNPGSTNAFGAAGGNSSDAEERQRGTNPLDFDSDNDYIDDGVEVAYICEAPQLIATDNDGDGLTDEDPIDGLDNDGDGLIDEDPEDFTFITVTNLSPLARDSDSDGFIDGLEDLNLDDKFDPEIGETNPCASPPIPIVVPIIAQPADTDGDGFSDEDERAAGTDLHDPDSHPTAFIADLDLDGVEDDRLWLEDPTGDGVADSVALDINSNVQVDIRIEIIEQRDYQMGDFNDDGNDDDCRYTIVYAMANQRALQPRIVLGIYDLGCDLVIDWVQVERQS